MDVLILLIRIFLAVIFAVAGIGKLLDLEGSEKAVKAFGTPDEFAKFFAIALPFAEIVFAFVFIVYFSFVARRNRRDRFAFEFYRRDDFPNRAGKCAGLSLFRRDSQRAGFQKEFDSQHYFCDTFIFSGRAGTRKSRVGIYRFNK